MDQEEIEVLQGVYAQTLYTLRESRKAMLGQYGVNGEQALLAQIGVQVDEHQGYEHYLGAHILGQLRAQVSRQLQTECMGLALQDDAQNSAQENEVLHLQLKEQIDAHYATRLRAPVRLTQDALLFGFDSELEIELRYFTCDEYSIAWSWGEARLRIDTAPLHHANPTFPHHLHDDMGCVRADPVTVPGTPCWPNLRRLIDALLVDPLLLDPVLRDPVLHAPATREPSLLAPPDKSGRNDS